MPLVLRSVKGSPLTAAEVDGNFSYLDETKVGASGAAVSGYVLSSTGQGNTPVWSSPTSLLGTSGYSGYSGYSGFSGATGPTVYPALGIPVSTGSEWNTSKNVPVGDIIGTTDTQTLSNKTLTSPVLNNSTITNYVESVVSNGVVSTTKTIDLTSGTVQTATLTASTACTFTMPTPVAGKSFVLFLKQASTTGNGTATFTGVKWGIAGTPTITAAAGKIDIFSFISDGTNWYGSATQGYTP